MFTVTLHDSLDSIPRLDALFELLQAELRVEVRSSLAHALQPGSRAKLVVLSEARTGEPAGFAFFNVGSGLESGGDYIWLNEIHVSESFRGQGGGRAMNSGAQFFAAVWALSRKRHAGFPKA
jgi:GNAT superfamily N-acetyltransferase